MASDIMKMEHDLFKNSLRETVTTFCNNSLSFNKTLFIQGLIGITIDDKDLFLINVNQLTYSGCSAAEGNSSNNALDCDASDSILIVPSVDFQDSVNVNIANGTSEQVVSRSTSTQQQQQQQGSHIVDVTEGPTVACETEQRSPPLSKRVCLSSDDTSDSEADEKKLLPLVVIEPYWSEASTAEHIRDAAQNVLLVNDINAADVGDTPSDVTDQFKQVECCML